MIGEKGAEVGRFAAALVDCVIVWASTLELDGPLAAGRVGTDARWWAACLELYRGILHPTSPHAPSSHNPTQVHTRTRGHSPGARGL